MTLRIQGSTVGYDMNGMQQLINDVYTNCVIPASQSMRTNAQNTRYAIDQVWVGASAESFKEKLSNDTETLCRTLEEVAEAIKNDMNNAGSNVEEYDAAIAQALFVSSGGGTTGTPQAAGTPNAGGAVNPTTGVTDVVNPPSQTPTNPAPDAQGIEGDGNPGATPGATPAPASETPGEGETPADPGQTPAPASETPTEGGEQNPTEGEQTPTEGEQKSEEEARAEEEQRQQEEAAKAEEEAKAKAEEEAKAKAEEEAKVKAEEEAKAKAEEEAKAKAEEEARVAAEEKAKEEQARAEEEARQKAEEEAKAGETTPETPTDPGQTPTPASDNPNMPEFNEDGLLKGTYINDDNPGLYPGTPEREQAQAVINGLDAAGHSNAVHSAELNAKIDALTPEQCVWVLSRIEDKGFGQTGAGQAGKATPESHQKFIEQQVNERFGGDIHELLKHWGTYSYTGY